MALVAAVRDLDLVSTAAASVFLLFFAISLCAIAAFVRVRVMVPPAVIVYVPQWGRSRRPAAFFLHVVAIFFPFFI